MGKPKTWVVGVLISVLGACAHVRTGPPVSIPPLCPVTSPGFKPLSRAGFLFVQVIYEAKREEGYAFVIFVQGQSPTVENFVGPMKTDEDWRQFNNALGTFRAARPGGFYCDGIPQQDKTTQAAAERCPDNHLALDVQPERGQRLAWGPILPSPPPPNAFGYAYSVEQQPVAMWSDAVPQALYASLSDVPPPGCQTVQPNDVRIGEVQRYVQKAVEAVRVLNGEHPYP